MDLDEVSVLAAGRIQRRWRSHWLVVLWGHYGPRQHKAALEIQTSWRSRRSHHTKARSELNEEYIGRRRNVPDALVPWSQPWRGYEPAYFDAAVVVANGRDQPDGAKWADPARPLEMRSELDARTTYSVGSGTSLLADAVAFDERSGAPLNPRGRTGLRGRGLLGKWGPNHAADPIVTRWEPLTGHLQVIAILRKDTHEWALPGGIVAAGESMSATVRRSIQDAGDFSNDKSREEFGKLVDELFTRGHYVFMGYSDDPRNTDNAWMESKVVHFHFHCTHTLGALGALLPLRAGKGRRAKAGAVVWLDADTHSEPRYAAMYGSHRQWVEQAIANLNLVNTSEGKVSGMRGGEARVFAADAARIGTVAEARERCLLDRCVKKTISPSGEHENDSGVPIDVETFPLGRASYRQLQHYGCNVAVTLLLRFYVELSAVLLGMCALSLWALVDNRRRSDIRSRCRDSLANATLYDLLTANRSDDDDGTGGTADDGTADGLVRQCGYSGLSIQRSLANRTTDGFLAYALGSCSEYGGEGVTQTRSSSIVATVELHPLLATPDAQFCVDSSVGFWLEVVSVGLALAFLWRQRRINHREAARHDKATLTASDYAAMIEGLEIGTNPDDEPARQGLENRLYADLEALGFGRDDIDHVEVGVECDREAKCLRKLARLQVEKQELQAQRRKARSLSESLSPVRRGSAGFLRSLRGNSATPQSPSRGGSPTSESSVSLTAAKDTQFCFCCRSLGERLERRIHARIEQHQKELTDLHSAAQRTTGHAFVVFQLEESRNRFVRLFERSTWRALHGTAKDLLATLAQDTVDIFRGSDAPQLEAAKYRPVRVRPAPAPSDIEWENLHVTPAYRTRVALSNVAAVLAVMLCSAGMLLVVTTGQEVLLEHSEDATSSRGGGGGGGGPVSLLLTRFTSLAAAIISYCTNYLLKRTCTHLTRRERRITKTGYERALFMKLAVAYTVNTCGVAFAVAFLRSWRKRYFEAHELGKGSLLSPATDGDLRPGGVVNQDWFESGDLIGYVFYAHVWGALPDLIGAVRPRQLFNRLVRARLVTGQHKLNRLWRPPRMPMARMYAEVVKDVSLCLVFGPLFPLAYLLAALRLLLSFGTTLFTITFFYGRPAALTAEIMARMTTVLGCLVYAGVVIKYFAYEGGLGDAPLVATGIVIAVHAVMQLGAVVGLEEYSSLDVVDTDGVRYEDVADTTGVVLERYQSPEVRVHAGRGAAHRDSTAEDSMSLLNCVLKHSSGSDVDREFEAMGSDLDREFEAITKEVSEEELILSQSGEYSLRSRSGEYHV